VYIDNKESGRTQRGRERWIDRCENNGLLIAMKLHASPPSFVQLHVIGNVETKEPTKCSK